MSPPRDDVGATAPVLDQLGQDKPARYREVEPEQEQWLQRHPEAGSSWPGWSKAAHPFQAVDVLVRLSVDSRMRPESWLTNPPGHFWRDKWTALSGPLSGGAFSYARYPCIRRWTCWCGIPRPSDRYPPAAPLMRVKFERASDF
jgi:hypothetical protein